MVEKRRKDKGTAEGFGARRVYDEVHSFPDRGSEFILEPLIVLVLEKKEKEEENGGRRKEEGTRTRVLH